VFQVHPWEKAADWTARSRNKTRSCVRRTKRRQLLRHDCSSNRSLIDRGRSNCDGRLTIYHSSSTSLATVTLIGLPLLAPRDNAGTHVREQPGDMMPVRDGSSVARTSPALVVTASQKKYVNEPLPLGMWLNNDSGKETVTIDGLLEGTELSLGTSRGLAGWVLTGGDLDKTFVGPPRDFVGVMNATVELSSAGGQLLESQVIQFEWIAKTEYVLRPVVEPAKPPAVVPSHPAPVVPSLNRT
jgi:hypothetical protein